ncbi:hypothetical protein B0H14DRAFT_2560663 [Mycena olivaceomarginata]|nr:hypothetical protein B0H14DRAFT_2560663 [Mycena olivaceomarginata]
MVALGLQAVFRAAWLRSGWGCGRLFCAAWLRSGCGRYSVQHGCTRVGVAGGHSAQHGCARVVGGIPRSTVVLGLRVVFCAARLRSGCGRLFRAARLRSGCGRYSVQHGCARVAGGIPRCTVEVEFRLQAVFRTA